MTTLSGRTLGRMRTTFSGGSPDSPNSAITSSQDLFEPIWLDYASSFPEATLEFGVRVESVAESADGVLITTRRLVSGAEGYDGDSRGSNEDTRQSDSVESDWSGHSTGAVFSDETQTLRAKYIISCDGWHSTVREQFGVGFDGPRDLSSQVNCLFRADMRRFVPKREDGSMHGAILFWITDPDAYNGVFQPVDPLHEHRWMTQIGFDPSRESLADFTPERCKECIYSAVGASDFPIEVLSTNAWSMNASVALEYRLGEHGRIFLAGDVSCT